MKAAPAVGGCRLPIAGSSACCCTCFSCVHLLFNQLLVLHHPCKPSSRLWSMRRDCRRFVADAEDVVIASTVNCWMRPKLRPHSELRVVRERSSCASFRRNTIRELLSLSIIAVLDRVTGCLNTWHTCDIVPLAELHRVCVSVQPKPGSHSCKPFIDELSLTGSIYAHIYVYA